MYRYASPPPNERFNVHPHTHISGSLVGQNLRRIRFVAAIIAAVALVFGALFVTSISSAHATTTDQTLWGSAAPTGLVPVNDTNSVEVGTRFTATSNGKATGVRFWKTSGNQGTHVGSLWSSTGTILGSVKFTGESASGWQTARFASPVALQAGNTYVVSYHAPKGGYAASYYFSGRSTSPSLSVASNSGVYRYGSSSRFPSSTYRSSQYFVDLTFAPALSSAAAPTVPTPTTSPKPTSTPTTTPKPTATPKPTSTPTTPKPTSTPTAAPTQAPSPATSTGFPNHSNTGVPAGTALSAYTGPCTVTAANTVIDAKTINCSLDIRANGVSVTRSVVNGTVSSSTGSSFTVSDSDINVGAQAGTGIGDANFVATRVEITGGNRSVNCSENCTVQDSYVHGQFTDSTGVYHESGIRMGAGSTIRHNTIACTAPDVAPDAGCSAALTGYGDFAVVQNNVIDGNQFLAGSGGYCSYGGSTTGKPYSAGVNNIRFTNNVWQRGSGGKCGFWGPITSFDSSAPGNVWSNNKWDDGTTVAPAN